MIVVDRVAVLEDQDEEYERVPLREVDLEEFVELEESSGMKAGVGLEVSSGREVVA